MGKKNIPYIEETYDVVVVGAGHAGCEAALACARLGLETMMFTVSVDSIALMPMLPHNLHARHRQQPHHMFLQYKEYFSYPFFYLLLSHTKL